MLTRSEEEIAGGSEAAMGETCNRGARRTSASAWDAMHQTVRSYHTAPWAGWRRTKTRRGEHGPRQTVWGGDGRLEAMMGSADDLRR